MRDCHRLAILEDLEIFEPQPRHWPTIAVGDVHIDADQVHLHRCEERGLGLIWLLRGNAGDSQRALDNESEPAHCDIGRQRRASHQLASCFGPFRQQGQGRQHQQHDGVLHDEDDERQTAMRVLQFAALGDDPQHHRRR